MGFLKSFKGVHKLLQHVLKSTITAVNNCNFTVQYFAFESDFIYSNYYPVAVGFDTGIWLKQSPSSPKNSSPFAVT